MAEKLMIYNTLSKKKEIFKPINPPFVGMYVCGPTVYGEPHLGHVRMAIAYDLLFRFLMHIGYKVRYVRNITDVGHLEDELAGEGQDRISKRAKIEQLEPMEVVQKYKNIFNDIFRELNVMHPSIEPLASGHIIEQQLIIKKIIENGYAYEINGSVYFDVSKYSKKYNYGKLSGRKIEDLLNNTRELEGQSEKQNPLDFALWKKASSEHLMHWPSDWSEGFPGWHLECSVMGTKYLGDTFDIHGGGMDLLFPHHECEIAQSVAASGKEHVKYWMHNNMITIDGQKMAKSLNNFITLKQLFSGEHSKLEQAYSPMTVRFFILQAQYRGTLDFSNEALKAAEKGLERLFTGITTLNNLPVSENSTINVDELEEKLYSSMNDDLNSPVLISHLFDGVRFINSVKSGSESVSAKDKEKLIKLYKTFTEDILGLKPKETAKSHDQLLPSLINMLLDNRIEAKKRKDFNTADKIRNQLNELGIIVKDTKEGYEWEIDKN